MSDETKDVKVPITNPGLIMMLSRTRVLEDLADELKDLQKDFKLAGLVLASAHVRAQAAEARMELTEVNIQHAIKHGVDLSTHALQIKGNGSDVYLLATPIDQEPT